MSRKCRHCWCLWVALFLLSIAIALQVAALILPTWLRMSGKHGNLTIGLWEICGPATAYGNGSTGSLKCPFSTHGSYPDIGVLEASRWPAAGGLTASVITALLTACSTLTLGLRDYQVNLGLALAAIASGGFVAVAIFGLSGEAHNIVQQSGIEGTRVTYELCVGLEIASVALLWTVGLGTVVFALWSRSFSSKRKTTVVTGMNISSKLGGINEGFDNESSADSGNMESEEMGHDSKPTSPGTSTGWRQGRQSPGVFETVSGTNIVSDSVGMQSETTNEETQF